MYEWKQIGELPVFICKVPGGHIVASKEFNVLYIPGELDIRPKKPKFAKVVDELIDELSKDMKALKEEDILPTSITHSPEFTAIDIYLRKNTTLTGTLREISDILGVDIKKWLLRHKNKLEKSMYLGVAVDRSKRPYVYTLFRR